MQVSPTHAVLLSMVLLAGGSLLTLALSGNKKLAGWASFLAVAAASCLTLKASAAALLTGPDTPVAFKAISVWGSTLRFSIDGLAAVFLGLIAIVSSLAAFYSISYMDHYKDYSVARYYPWFLLFVAGMYGIVICTDTMVFFCFFWQLMTIPSFALIRFESRKPENIRAANKYLVVMEIACLLIMAGFYLLASRAPVHEGGLSRFDFDMIREIIPFVSPKILSGALSLMLVGFAIKAGAWPFGLIWLPDAHPAAPSPVSALLSGVMIKTGIYGLIRTFFWLVPNADVRGFSPLFWGGLLAVVGTVTLVVGTFQALKQEQTKRLLAFHSIGQVGYIVLGLGASLMLLPFNAGTLATVALIGALFHTVNHALFKSLLFFNAGTVLKATDTQDLNKLGGLMSMMPITAVTCLVASFSIAGVPLFNGFASKWSIYSATILGGHYAPLLAVCGLFGILTSVLTLASFMKFFGVAFLSRRSTLVNERIKSGTKFEADFFMQVPQVLLAIACVMLGLLPALGYIVLNKALAAGPAGISQYLPSLDIHLSNLAFGIVNQGGEALFMPLVIAVILAALFLFVRFFAHLGKAKRRSADIWLCGYDKEADIHRYGAHNLYGDVKHLFNRKH
ncbi:MAG: hypothetical protein MUF22_07315 [Chitinispirillaceae bacterium]|jgi:formate hydrogenlyase subunit 3/multisubunit Na+/H+ antiporter MnhD subunit|nr:hypothetical protein [Chitinispirillaceae bacterium]